MKIGCVIPAVESRIENLNLVLESLVESFISPDQIVIVADGWKDESLYQQIDIQQINTYIVGINKHSPGDEQPRNVGVQFLDTKTDFIWFLDSDCIVDNKTLFEFKKAEEIYPDTPRILIGPYEWMGPGKTKPQYDLKNDPRWAMFATSDPRQIYWANLGVALGNFSGNLFWPYKEFIKSGGFWNELHMGRCEDGELGLRAASLNIPMGMVKTARAWHIDHPTNHKEKLKKNKRDVPMINERHPWVQEQGLIVVDEDGKRFDQICPSCDTQINSLLYWSHQEKCQLS